MALGLGLGGLGLKLGLGTQNNLITLAIEKGGC